MSEIYQDVLAIAKTYMGLAAKEYIGRRCRVSLEKNDPADLQFEDIDRLAAGIELTAGAYLTEEKARRFKEDVLELKQKYRQH